MATEGKPQYLTLPEVKLLLEKEQERRELNHEQRLSLVHSQQFSQLTKTKALQLIRDLLKIERVTPASATKLADILPTYPEEVRAIFAKERFTLEEDEVKKMLKVVRGYL